MTTYNPDLLDTAPGVRVPTRAARHKSSLVYPARGYNNTNITDAIQAPAGEITEVQIELGASVKSIQQPVCVKAIDDSSIVPDFSCYVVSSANGHTLSPKAWRQFGGRITGEVNRDTVTATLRVYAPAVPSLSPFTIGYDDGEKTYAALYLLGDGVGIIKRTVTWETGLSDDLVADDTTAEYDNAFLQTEEQALDAAHSALCRKIGSFQTVTLTCTGIRDVAGAVALRPETALGRVAGARVLWDGLYYRVRSAAISAAQIVLTCEQDVRFSDMNDAFPDGLTFDQLGKLHADARFRDFGTDPFAGGTVG